MKNDYCEECGGKPGGHKPYCSERFKSMDERSQMQWTKEMEAAERRLSRKGLIRFWQLVVATIAALAVVGGLLWQII